MSVALQRPVIRRSESSSVVINSYNKKISQTFGKEAAIMLEWMRYSCNENYQKNGNYLIPVTIRELSKIFNRSISSVKRCIAQLKQEDILIVGKSYDHHCRQNTYTIGPSYFDIVEKENNNREK